MEKILLYNIFLDNADIIELIIYICYIYGLIVLGILVKPTVLSMLILGAYVYYTTWNILAIEPCVYRMNVAMAVFVFMYTVGCVMVYKLTHYIYWEKRKYIYLLLFLPFGYFIAVKTCFSILNRNPYSNLLYAFSCMRYVFQNNIQ
jgi:hypothetical protein